MHYELYLRPYPDEPDISAEDIALVHYHLRGTFMSPRFRMAHRGPFPRKEDAGTWWLRVTPDELEAVTATLKELGLVPVHTIHVNYT